MSSTQAGDRPRAMSREAFRAWAEQQPKRYERIDGEPVEMAAERAVHNILKGNAFLALRDAITASGVPCQAFTDGMAVEIGDDGDFEPDALVRCGERLANDDTVATSPVVVVEVLSPSTSAYDAGHKLMGYLSTPGIRHVLMVDARRQRVVHHRRGDDGSIATALVREWTIALDPPGLSIAMDDLYRDAGL